ncbi:MAG: NUDIX hydrolase [Candidatus Moranbacteria bacterium GW2011_GWC2_37_73]|nr:MAG: NUDIX hydrolase [Parcubacteria group bacterium GW2011_GWC1_36_108]KKQ39312.1 MAG: NUDIX hydrolase [Candidatus Moranbacteria bacterium GW2011_GWC2_37_73]
MKIEKPKSTQLIPEHAKKVFSGTFFDVYQWEQEMFDGSKKIKEYFL